MDDYPEHRWSQFRQTVAVFLFSGVLCASLWHVFLRTKADDRRTEKNKTTLYIGHWLISVGMREALDSAIERYKEIRPDVRILQVPVHGRVYPAWMRAQLVGGTAPDIMGLRSLNEEAVSRYFTPLTTWFDQPNPYNKGTRLESIPWRDTFVDGLTSVRNFTSTSGEIHGVMLQLNSHRVYYNRELLKKVTGSTLPPKKFHELQEIAEELNDYNKRTDQRIVTLAISGNYARWAFDWIVPSQTQKLVLALSPSRNLRVTSIEFAALILDGKLSYSTPEIRKAIELMRDTAQLFPAGFMQMDRDEAMRSWAQGRALMLFAGSWDYAALLQDVDFSMGAIPIPTPQPEDPYYGEFSLGAVAESGGADGAMGVVRQSKTQDEAIEFLRYLTSQPVAAEFSQKSMRLSGIIETPLPLGLDEITPRLEGEIPGFAIDFREFSAGHASNFFQRHSHEVIGKKGNIDDFIEIMNSEIHRYLREDIAAHLSHVRWDTRRLDAAVVLSYTLPYAHPKQKDWARHAKVQHGSQIETLRYRTYIETP